MQYYIISRWIFWTDIGKQPKIERSKLDGTNRNVLVLQGLIKPVSITIDSTTFDIYWTDPVRRTIESCDFYGNNRKVFRTDVNRKYYGIEILKVYYNTVYILGRDRKFHAFLRCWFLPWSLINKEHTCLLLLPFQTFFSH